MRPSARRLLGGALAALVALAASGCGTGRRVAVLADPLWWAAAGASVEPEVGRVARVHGLGLEVVSSADTGLPAALRRRPPELLLAGPVAAASADAIAAALPQTLVLVAGPEPPARPANLAALRYSPEEAFVEAGRRAAAAGPDCLVGVLAPPGSGAAAAFREGFLSAGASGRLRERAVSAAAERTDLRRAVDDLLAQGVRLFLVAMRSATPQCLELLEGRGSLAVVEGQQASDAFSSLVLATVEPDWGAAVEAALAAPAQRPSEGEIRMPARLVVSRALAPGAAWPCAAGTAAAVHTAAP